MQRWYFKKFHIIRAFDWWDSKLPPILATIYATVFLLKLSVSALWPLLLLSLVALIPGAAYVSVINDLTDMQEDLSSGKKNRLVGKSRQFIALLLVCCVLPGIVIAFSWRNDPLLLELYLAAWTAFSLYSLPPVRLKHRGILGVFADSSGSHLFPTLLVVTLVYHRQHKPVDPVWFAAVAFWAFNYGLRGILWHQLGDAHYDVRISLRTFVQRHPTTFVRQLAAFCIFPIEMASFALLLWRAANPLAIGFLLLYMMFVWLRKTVCGLGLIIADPKPGGRIAMQEYYEFFYPLSFLIASSFRYHWDALVIIASLLLFPRRAIQILADTARILRTAGRNHR